LEHFEKRKLLGPLDLYQEVIDKRRREQERLRELANQPTAKEI
jgi:hypothetical protein